MPINPIQQTNQTNSSAVIDRPWQRPPIQPSPNDLQSPPDDPNLYRQPSDYSYRRYWRAYALVNGATQYAIPKMGVDSQAQVDWACAILRRDYHMTFARIADMVHYRNESGARMAVNRYFDRTLATQRGYAYQLGTGSRRNTTPVTLLTRKFGVEIEFRDLEQHLAAEAIQSVTNEHCHITEYHGRRCTTCRDIVGYDKWKIERDSTVTRSEWDSDEDTNLLYGGEAVAPIGSGQAHLDQIGKVMRALRAAGATVDRQAGMHVHLNMKDMGKEGLAQLVLHWQQIEDFMFGLCAPSRRNNSYCQPMSLSEAQQIAQQFRTRGTAYGNRGALNVTCYPKLGTFEFRLHQGTLNARKMDSWVKLLLGITQSVKERKHQLYQPNLSLLGSLTADGFLEQQAGSYLFARHAQLNG